MVEQDLEAMREGFSSPKKCSVRVVGQTALLEANLDIEIAATVDVDAFIEAESLVIAQFSQLLRYEGLEYDQLSNEIWMPEETKYVDIFRGDWVVAMLAQPEFVMLSKAKMALGKNKMLLRDYIASEPAELFFRLCEKYRVNIENILKD